MLDPHEFAHHYANINGIRMHYVQVGYGPELIVMLHGFPECWWSWRYQLALFRDTPALAKHYTVVVPDLRGYNETEQASWGYELDVLVQDVIELIRAQGKRSAIVVGHDWGGNIAWSLAISRPEWVKQLIALNIPHPALFAEAIGRNWQQMRRSWYIGFFQLPWLPERMISANDYAFIERAFLGMAIDKTPFTPQDIQIFKAAMAKPGAATAAVNYYRALVQKGTRGMFRGTGMRVTGPTLLIWGERDMALGKELTYGTERYAPNVRIHYIPNCSHWVQQERAPEVNALILDFLQEMTQSGNT